MGFSESYCIFMILTQIEIQVFERLQKLHLCLSHKATIAYMTLLGIEHDAEVHEWKKNIEAEMKVFA